MDYVDYYKILDVDRTVSPDDIQKAYRKLARKYHPDVNPGDQEAEARYKEIVEAQAVLLDPHKRARYDQLSETWQAHQRNGGTAAEFEWDQWFNDAAASSSQVNAKNGLGESIAEPPGEVSDFFTSIFGGAGETTGQVQRQGGDYHQKVEITLEEAFRGTSRILRIGGRRIEVRIPKGARAGTKIRVRGEGSEGSRGGSKGDLYLEIQIAEHPLFQWIGDDLHTDLPVDLYTAILGGEAVVSTFKGRIKLKIPPETQSGRSFRLKGQGMPRLKQPDERGDLYAKVVVQLPQNLTPEEIALFEELADIRGL